MSHSYTWFGFLISFDVRQAMHALINVAVNYQLKRPGFSALLDNEETRLAKAISNSEGGKIVRLALVSFFTKNNNPIIDPSIAATDVIEIIRSLTDAAAKRAESNPDALQNNIERAVFSYLAIG